ncbi:MAG: hypothetical protein AAFV53_07500 [Myxococcota bacterium]
MHNPRYLEAFGAVDVEVDLDGWRARIPASYRPWNALGVVTLMLLATAVFALCVFLAPPGLAVLLLVFPLLTLYGAFSHGFRALQSTDLLVQHGDMKIQRRLVGNDWGAPMRVPLADAAVSITGTVGIQKMTIGPHTFPVHAAKGDLHLVKEMIEESRQIARGSGAISPVPQALRRMMGQTPTQ